MLNKTIGGMLEEMAQRFPNNLAVKYTDSDYERTYSEFNAECDEIAKGFLKLGVKKGDHVAIWATNKKEWLLTLFGTAKIGAILVTVNTNYKVFEVEYLLRQSDSNVLVFMEGLKDTNYVNIMRELCPDMDSAVDGKVDSFRLPYLKNLIYCGDKEHSGLMNFEKLYEMAKDVSDEELQAVKDSLDVHDVINMQYTSGTTGFPKGVMLTHYNIINDGKSIGDCMKFTDKDKLCIPVPFFHCFGLVLAITACLTHGSAMVPIEVFSPVKVMAAIESEKCTAVHGVPTMFIAMLEHKEFEKYDFSSLRTGIMAGSPCPIKVMELVVEKMNMKEITIAYGQTEASPVCTQTTTDDPIELRVSTVGRAIANVECKIIDVETGEELGPNMQGEFCARGYNIMKGYYKMPEATANAIDEDGWLHTGDLAMVDENGYYKITGRIKDMIIRGGENIYPKEIEEFLYTHEKVKDVQIIGVPSVAYGEEVCACIIARDNVTLTEEEVKEAVRGSMARHKIPSYVWFVDEFPMTASGKIQKFILREQAIEKFNLGEAAAIETA